MKLRRIFGVLFALCLVVSVMALSASAKTVASGDCGDNGSTAKWTLDSDGVLTISGTGEMDNYWQDVYPAPWSPLYYGMNVTKVVIEEGITTIGEMAFADCSDLKSITIPDSVTWIGYGAFDNCSRLAAVDIPDSVTFIGWHAFSGCSSLKSITIPDSVTDIGQHAFSQCTSLTTVKLPKNLKSIGSFAFSGSAIQSITFPESVNLTDIGIGVFLNCSDLKKIVFFGDAPEVDDEELFDDLTATVYYPSENATWTADKRPDFDGAITWVKMKPLKLTAQPKTTYTPYGAAAKATVGASGDGLTYTWYVKNKGASTFKKSSVTSAAYSVSMGATTMGRQVYCVVTDRYGRTVKSNTATLRMAVTIRTQPKTTYTKSGAFASATVKAAGEDLTYTWYIKNSGATAFKKSSVTGSSYGVKMSSTTKDRQLYCVVKDKFGNTAKTETVYLRMAATVTTQPKTTYTKNGSTAKVTVKAVGDGLKYTWYYRNAGATKFTKSSTTTATYSTTMDADRKNRQVFCIVRDKYGKAVQTNKVYLRMAASITTQPKTVTVKKNATAKVTVKAAGDGLEYTWYIKNKGDKKFTKSSVTTATYSAKMTSKVSGRQVYCVVKDKYGKTVKSSTATLKMK